ncbi:MAG: alpha-2-macroglobulin family protein, partial [Candidatus Hinthialibacter sp.]
TLPDGTPTASELSLAVVDEAIFAIRSDHTPQIHSTFYDRQSNWVITTYSYPLHYYGGANKGVMPDIRKDFRDTALWEANVYTGENGLGSVKITYPDNLTTWRLTARAHTKNSEVGWTKSKSLVTKDIVARLSLPRFFTENDRLKIPTLVNNLSDANLPDIQTRLTVEGGVKLNEANEKKTQAAAGAVARENWEASVTADSPSATFVFEAQSPQDRDALQLSAPVLPLGYRFQRFQTGKISEPVIQVKTALDDNIRLSQSNVQLSITPSLASAALGAIPYLAEFPYGCVEQTLNGFLPNLLLLHTLDDLGALSPDNRQALEQIGPTVEISLKRLYSLQKYNGAWGWFSSSPEDLFLTAMVVHGLKQVNSLGYAIDKNRFKNGVEYLQSNISNTRVWDSQAYTAYVLSVVVEKDPPLLNELHVNRNELSEFGLAVSALAFYNRGKDAQANEILDLLLSRLTSISDQQSAWNASPDRRWDWYGSASETNAWGLKSLVALRGLTPEAEKIVQWLMAQRWGERWRSTRETAAVVDALRFVIQHEAKEDNLSDLEYTIMLNKEPVKKGSITKNQFTHKISLPLPLQLGGNTIELQLNRPQGYWSLEESLFRQGEIHQPEPHAEFELTRLYERAIHTRDYRGRPKILAEGFSPDDALNTGQEILITLVIQSKQDIPYMIVEDPLPSGCEIIESFLELGQSSWRPYTHYERRDQKMVFFLNSVPKGETRIEYLMRAELQGVFRANPAHAWCMYDPLYSAHSAGNRLQVK